jgi:hypothetical protein
MDRSGAQDASRSARVDASREPTQTSQKTPSHTADFYQSGDIDDTHSSAIDRIIALVQPSATNDPGRKSMDDRAAEQRDRTYLAVRRQLNALKCEKYDIGIRNRDGKMMTRTWSQDEVLKSVSWLKRENAKGADIYVRPAGDKNQGIILVDDLNQSQLKNMKSKGYEPANVVETSPQNYQAWVRLTDKRIDPTMATGISKGMAKTFGADPNSADWRHFGRLAGFTNQKPEHKTEQGRSPWVLCHESSGKQASRGQVIMESMFTRAKEMREENEQEQRRKQAVEAQQGTSKANPIRMYQNEFNSLRRAYGADMDLSRADFMICSKMLKVGYSKDQLIKTLEQTSPELRTRKASHENDYCTRTVDAAFANPQVQAHLKHQQETTKSKSADFSR